MLECLKQMFKKKDKPKLSEKEFIRLLKTELKRLRELPELKGGAMKFKVGDVVKIITPRLSLLDEAIDNGFSWSSPMDDTIGEIVVINDKHKGNEWRCSNGWTYPDCAMQFISRPEAKKETVSTLESYKEAIKKVDWKKRTPLEVLLATTVKYLLKKDDQSTESSDTCPGCLSVGDITAPPFCKNCSLHGNSERSYFCCGGTWVEWDKQKTEANAVKVAMFALGKAIEEMGKK